MMKPSRFFTYFKLCEHEKTLKCTIQLKSLHDGEVKVCVLIQNPLSVIIAMHYIGTASFRLSSIHITHKIKTDIHFLSP